MPTALFPARLAIVLLVLALFAAPVAAQEAQTLDAGAFRLRIEPEGMRFTFLRPDGSTWVAAHGESGIQLAREGGEPAPLRAVKTAETSDTHVTLEGETGDGVRAVVRFEVTGESGAGGATGATAKVSVRPMEEGRYTIVARTAPLAPSFGLADHGGSGRATTDLAGFVNEDFHASTGIRPSRMVSNFVIFPRQGFAEVNIEPRRKIVRLTDQENAQGSRDVREMPAMMYFLGTPRQIYASFLKVRNAAGYTVHRPKYAFFGVGWEAWGALAWDTNERTVRENIDRYLDAGYPLRWMVIGSGFWPREEARFHATTSFGMWDPKLYPDPKGLIRHYQERGLKFFIGLRISFITDGPFAEEGVRKGYFLKDEAGSAKVYRIAFPKSPCYLLDAHNPEALKWYLGLCDKWLEYGVDGFKEDLFGYRKYVLRDDKIDPINDALMRRGVYVMGRNAYLGSPADVHRIEDFNFNQDQDRGPINGLAFGYSGFPYVYPDLVGGLRPKDGKPLPGAYLARFAQYASVNPVMAMGYGPWNSGDATAERVMLEAAKLHARLHPYIYSAAIDAWRDGYPHTLTPLPVAYPDDPGVYGRENNQVRGYQWLIGPSLMAVPLYGDDYATAQTRDVYLPKGVWIDYDTGDRFEGPRVVEGFKLPIGKTPLLVGGEGIVIEEEGEKRIARVYPVKSRASFTFNDQDGEATSKIETDIGEFSGEAVRVYDAASGEVVEHRRARHAMEFDLAAGRSYRVTDRGR